MPRPARSPSLIDWFLSPTTWPRLWPLLAPLTPYRRISWTLTRRTTMNSTVKCRLWRKFAADCSQGLQYVVAVVGAVHFDCCFPHHFIPSLRPHFCDFLLWFYFQCLVLDLGVKLRPFLPPGCVWTECLSECVRIRVTFHDCVCWLCTDEWNSGVQRCVLSPRGADSGTVPLFALAPLLSRPVFAVKVLFGVGVGAGRRHREPRVSHAAVCRPVGCLCVCGLLCTG